MTAERVTEVVAGVLDEHEWRWALRDTRTDEGVRIACTAPDCTWFAERGVEGQRRPGLPRPDLWDMHRAHVTAEIAAALSPLLADTTLGDVERRIELAVYRRCQTVFRSEADGQSYFGFTDGLTDALRIVREVREGLA